MSGLPIHKIIWAPAPLHDNHLHVEGSPRFSGTPPLTNPGRSPSIDVIYKALTAEFGTPYYFTDDPPAGSSWSHMGWYNRRPPRGSSTGWSQHAYANALDIGPYYGRKEQQVFYDFLTTYQGDDMSEAVKGIQRNLNKGGFTGANNKPLTIDGEWGPNTETAHLKMVNAAKAPGPKGDTGARGPKGAPGATAAQVAAEIGKRITNG